MQLGNGGIASDETHRLAARTMGTTQIDSIRMH